MSIYCQVAFLSFLINRSLWNLCVPYVFKVGLKARARNTIEPIIIAIVSKIHGVVHVHPLMMIRTMPEKTSTCPACFTTVIEVWNDWTKPSRRSESANSIFFVIGISENNGPIDPTALTIWMYKNNVWNNLFALPFTLVNSSIAPSVCLTFDESWQLSKNHHFFPGIRIPYKLTKSYSFFVNAKLIIY